MSSRSEPQATAVDKKDRKDVVTVSQNEDDSVTVDGSQTETAELDPEKIQGSLEQLRELCSKLKGAGLDLCFKDGDLEETPYEFPDGQRALYWVGNEQFSDCRVDFGEGIKPLPAHRIYLTRRSEYFRAMFRKSDEARAQWSEGTAKCPVVQLAVPDPKRFPNMLRYLYSGDISVLAKEFQTEQGFYGILANSEYLLVTDIQEELYKKFSLLVQNKISTSADLPSRFLIGWFEKTTSPESFVRLAAMTWAGNMKDREAFSVLEVKNTLSKCAVMEKLTEKELTRFVGLYGDIVLTFLEPRIIYEAFTKRRAPHVHYEPEAACPNCMNVIPLKYLKRIPCQRTHSGEYFVNWGWSCCRLKKNIPGCEKSLHFDGAYNHFAE
eukprot:20191_1